MSLGRRAFLAAGPSLLALTATAVEAAAPSAGPAPIRIHRRFVQIGDRRTEYLRAGNGPALVLCHAYPGSAMLMRRYLQIYAGEFTCFVFETPGMGLSDPIAAHPLTISDAADAIAEAMTALGLHDAVAFGVHSGGVAATELAARHPNLICGLIVDGLPLYSKEEIRTGFDTYFRPFEPDPEGSHLTWVWSRFRDQILFYPWNRHHAENIRSDLLSFIATPEGVNRTISGFYRGTDYIGPYRSAVFYGGEGARGLDRIAAPAAFLEAADDVTHSLARMPPLKVNQTTHALGPDLAVKDALILAKMHAFAGKTPPPRDRNPIGRGERLERHFLEFAHGDVLVRYRNAARGTPILLLHDAPGSARFLEDIVRDLGQDRPVYALDLPGCGESDALPGTPSLADFGAVVDGVCRALALGTPHLYGSGMGASLAAELGRMQPHRFGRIVLHGTLLPAPRERTDLIANLCPPIMVKPDGSHWYGTWQMLRDSEIFWPWYRLDAAAMRHADTDLGAQRLHDWTVDVVHTAASYHQLPMAALTQDLAATIGALSAPPILLIDPNHRFAGYSDLAARVRPDARLMQLGDGQAITDVLATALS